MATEIQASSLSQKFSRYRSVRHGASNSIEEPLPVQPSFQLRAATIARSKSRYKGTRLNKTTLNVQHKSVSEANQLQQPIHTRHEALSTSTHSRSDQRISKSTQEVTESDGPSQCHTLNPRKAKHFISSAPLINRRSYSAEAGKNFQVHEMSEYVKSVAVHNVQIDRARREAYSKLTGEAETQLQPEQIEKGDRARSKAGAKSQTSEVPRKEVSKEGHEIKRRKELQNQNSLKKLQHNQSDGEEVGQGTTRPTPLSERRPAGDERVFSTQGREKPAEGRKHQGLKNSKNEAKQRTSPPPSFSSPSEQIENAFDAPRSAVNAGIRMIKVKCNQSSVSLPITPSTTPIDLISSAAGIMPENIDPRAAVLLESFKPIGLERPLRRYEHIRDILNSWDQDDQNSLVIVPSIMKGDNDDLEAAKVSGRPPGEMSVHMYYSQKPGHWDKRWVTLRPDGQVLVAEQQYGNPRGAKNACHMSDFDIYLPTSHQLSKKIRPPRKWCFAIKSQQKSSIFLSTINYVHFFSTSDKSLAASWYKAIQEWRSWYLVHVMGEGHRNNTCVEGPLLKSNRPNDEVRSTSIPYSKHSPDRRPLKPNHSEDAATARPEEQKPLPLTDRSIAKPSSTLNRPIRTRKAPPVSFPSNFTNVAVPVDEPGVMLTQNRTSAEQESVPFALTGLLGRTYSQRQKVQREREAAVDVTGLALPAAFVAEASSSLPSHSTEQNDRSINGRAMSIRTVKKGPNGLTRTSSQRQTQKPLVDLTPQFQEAPQHAKKGRGIVPKQMPAGGLIDIATSPEVAVPVPPATTWRRPGTRNGEGAEAQGMDILLSSDRPIFGGSQPTPKDRGEAFAAGGLLATVEVAQGDRGQGRGIMTGNREATGPMLAVDIEPTYLPGSLLANAQKQESIHIDRDKRKEITLPVGEAA
ncbi:hypothetical protein MMC06_000718 [Schaereria dolodes]|nr:hypothetical protein [Schaereria dolodes]